MLGGVDPGRPPPGPADGLRPPRVGAVASWRAGKSAAEKRCWRPADLRDRDPARRAGAGPLGFPPLHELPVGGGGGHGPRGHRRGRKSGGPRRLRGAPPSRTHRRGSGPESQGVRRHPRTGAPHRSGLGEDPDRRSARRSRGRRLALLGRRDSPRPRCPGSRANLRRSARRRGASPDRGLRSTTARRCDRGRRHSGLADLHGIADGHPPRFKHFAIESQRTAELAVDA